MVKINESRLQQQLQKWIKRNDPVRDIFDLADNNAGSLSAMRS